MSTKTVLVTGCTGLVGHGICYYLLNKGYQVIGTARQSVVSEHSKFRIHQLDLLSSESIEQLREVFSDVDVVIHNAGIIPKEGREFTLEQGLKFFAVNFLATYQMLKIIEGYPDKKFIYISGIRLSQVYNDSVKENIPFATTDEYSTSKLCGELACCQFKNQGRLKPTVLRISAPYGYIINSSAVIPKFIQQARQSKDISLFGNGLREQEFTFVEDIGYACELAFNSGSGETFNITGGGAITMKDLAQAVLRAFPESKSKIIFIKDQDLQEDRKAICSIEKARKQLNYAPQFDIERGLKSIAESINNPSITKIFT